MNIKGEKQKMEFKTNFVAEDYSELCWFQSKGPTLLLAVLLGLAFGFMVFSLTMSLLIGVAVMIIAFVLSFVLWKRSIIKRADRRFGAFGASDMLYLKIDDDEILQTSNSGETRLPWEDVYAVMESENCYYVFLTKRKAFYFPKRSFESEEQKAKFFEYITKYVPLNKIKLKNK